MERNAATGESTGPGYARALRTGHVGLNVTDLPRSKRFYQEVFGFVVAAESEVSGKPFALLGKDGALVVTLWQQSPGETAFAHDRPGLHHLSFQVDALADVEALETRLKSLGVPLLYEGIVAHREGASSAALFFTDPDGIRLEVFSPTGGEGQAAPANAAPACGFF
jgi:lactoylglutathione lyase